VASRLTRLTRLTRLARLARLARGLGLGRPEARRGGCLPGGEFGGPFPGRLPLRDGIAGLGQAELECALRQGGVARLVFGPGDRPFGPGDRPGQLVRDG
jgi:hypothetical protein